MISKYLILRYVSEICYNKYVGMILPYVCNNYKTINKYKEAYVTSMNKAIANHICLRLDYYKIILLNS